MNIKKTLLVAALLGAPAFAYADIRLGVGINLGGPIVIRSAPPPPRREIIMPAPGPDYFWVSGRWDWRDGRWFWLGGHWVRRPYAQATWVPGHWDQQGGGWVWIEGQWVNQAPPPPAVVYQQGPPPPPSEEGVVQEAPPPPQVEHIGPPPAPDYFWVGGHWYWHGRWLWTRGHYERRPRSEARWEAGHWDRRGGGWIWIDGRWR